MENAMKKFINRIKAIIAKKPVMYTLWALSASIMTLALVLALRGCGAMEAGEERPQDADVCNGHHFYEKNVLEEPTCQSNGIVQYRCKTCFYTYEEGMYYADHNFVYSPEDSTSPSCREFGSKLYYCSYDCGASYSEQIDMLAHEFTVETYVAPTCMQDGYVEQVCTKCADWFCNLIEASYEHEYRTVDAVAATCTEDGWSEYQHCARCGENDKNEHIIGATGHNLTSEWIVDTAPTATTTGVRSHHCQNAGCDHVSDVTEIPKAGYTDFLKYQESSNYCTVTGILPGHESEIAILSIPEEYNGKPVMHVAANAFAGNSRIAVVKIPSSVINIYNGAFSACSNLTTLEVAPNADLQLIAYDAFAYCTQLSNMTLNEGLLQIEERAFENCGLTEVVIPDTVQMICHSAFKGCNRITSLTIPKVYDSAVDAYDRTYFLGFIFGATQNSASASYIPASLETLTFTQITELDYQTLMGCYNLKHLYLPETVTKIASNSFEYCTLLIYNNHDGVNYLGSVDNPYMIIFGATDKTKTTYEIKEGARFMMPGAFEDCTQLTAITLPAGITEISASAFKNCTALTTMPTMLGKVTTIGNNAFEGCSNMRGTLPEDVTIIGAYAFKNCSSLSPVTISSKVTVVGTGAFYKAGISSLSFTIRFEVTDGWRDQYGKAHLQTFISNTTNVTNAMQSGENYYFAR